MRVIVLLLLCMFGTRAAIADDQRERPLVYLAEINSFEYLGAPEPREIEREGEVRIIVSSSCGSYSVEFEIVESKVPLPEAVKISGAIGRWCRLDYEWPYDLYLIIAEGTPDNVVEVFPASSNEWLAYTELPTEFWKDDFKSWLGKDLVAALEPKLLESPLHLYLDELPRDFLEAYSCFHDELEDACIEDQDVEKAFKSIITFDGPVATIHQAISLDALFPDTAEVK